MHIPAHFRGDIEGTLLRPFEIDLHCMADGFTVHIRAERRASMSLIIGLDWVTCRAYALSIPANITPKRIPSVWTALQSLASARAVKLYLVNGSLASPRISVSRDPEVRAISPLIGAVDDLAARGYLRMWPRPPIPGISDIIAIAGEEIHDLLSGRKSVDDALTRAQNRADKMMRSRGYY